MKRAVFIVTACALGLAMGGLVAAPSALARGPRSIGLPQRGRLADAFEMPLQGPGYRFFAPVSRRGTHFATVELAALIARAARVLQRALPGPPIVLGDCSDRDGGALAGHASHQSGRDVDVILLATDATGQPRVTDRFVSYGADGRCVEPGCTLRLDEARTWWLVRTLLASREPAVQWIFVAEPIKRRLIAWAEEHREDPNLLRRARQVLRQPSDSDPHDDHLHVRIYCPPRARAPRCRDRAPRWPWVSRDGRADPL